ncbi:hypothetical protein [Alicyclobacillus fodiniaquatilis]|uniref:Tight adherence protein B n=1 Tax=Alicyclobacillus fodiniaquatilis TaxID=1661150 RepID=A0ABW4JI24_9BACL
MVLIFSSAGLIALAILLFFFSREVSQQEQIGNIRQWFGNVILVRRQESFWQKYMRNLARDAARANVPFNVEVWNKRIPIIGVVLFGVLMLLGIPPWIAVVLIALLALFPRQVLKEIANRHVIAFRKDFLKEAIQIGIHALSKARLEDACREIEKQATSKAIKREFHFVNEMGKAPGMTVAQAMVDRANELGVREYKTLSAATFEGQKRNANLREVWKDTEQSLMRYVSAQNAMASQTGMYRMAGMFLFIGAWVVVAFGYRAMHIKGIFQLGVVITLVSFFFGALQVSKSAGAD